MTKLGILNKWRNILYSWIARLNIVKMSVFHNFICRFNAIPIKVPAGYFRNINKLVLKFTWRCKILRRVNTILKKNEVGRLALPDFKTNY